MNGSISPWRSWKATSISVMARSATCNRKSTGAPTRDGRWLRRRKYRMRCGPRLKFVAGLLDGENMAALCRRFGVSSTTACKILQPAVWQANRSWRRPCRNANRLPVRIETLVVRSKQQLPGQRREYGGAGAALSGYLCWPSIRYMRFWTTMGWPSAGGVGVTKRPGTPPSACDQPNDSAVRRRQGRRGFSCR